MKFYGYFDVATPETAETKTAQGRYEESKHEANQREKLRIAIKMGYPNSDWQLDARHDRSKQTNDDERKAAAELQADAPELVTVLAIGRGAEFAVSVLAELAKINSRSIAERTCRPHIVNLILVVPNLPADFFAKDGPAIGDGSLVCSVCRRIVVLHGNGRLPVPGDLDTSLHARLGHIGPSVPSAEKVLNIDVSQLLIGHLPGVDSAVESLEVLGIIGRIVAGTGNGPLSALASRFDNRPPAT